VKSIKIIVASVVCAGLALGAISVPAGPAASAFAMGTLSSPLPPPAGTCVARAKVNIRSGPGSNTALVARMPRKSAFVVTQRSGRWLQGTSQWGNGWVMAALLRCAK
jgi:uncharacterized protein YraI